jgi:sulfate-transporting ATPase
MPAIIVYALLSIPFIGAYAMFALGISVIYRASRVLNLAHGAMAMVPAYAAYSMVKVGAPVVVALVVAIAIGAGLGIAVERLFVRRLRSQGSTAQTVGTIAVTGLLIAVAGKIWGTTPFRAPQVFPSGAIQIGQSNIRYGEIGIFVTAAAVSTLFFLFFSRTEYGLALRGSAQNRRAASLMGIDPDIAAAVAWGLGGGLAALAGVLLAAVTSLDIYTLSLQVLPAFVAALIGGLESLPGALWGAGIAGLSFGLVPYFQGTPVIGSIAGLTGAPQLALTILALVVMAFRGRRIAGAEITEAGLHSREARNPRMRIPGRSRALVAISVIAWPWIVPFSVLGTSLVWIELTLAAASLVVLTGFVGQISLSQASFVGIAALVTGIVTRGAGIGFPFSMFVAAATAAVAAVVLGIVALRVRGLYLAVATLIFAWMCDAFLFGTPWLGASTGSSTIPGDKLGDANGFPFIDLTSRRTLFYIFVAVAGIALFLLANLRQTRTGRAFFAIRGSEMAAAALGIDVVRYKLVAFALSGAVAGLAGNLIMTQQRTVVPANFIFTVSLQFLAIAVVGGLGSLGGAIAAGAVFAGLEEAFLRFSFLSGWLDVVSAGLLAVVLLVYPSGLAGLSGSFARIFETAKEWRAKRASIWLARLLKSTTSAQTRLERAWSQTGAFLNGMDVFAALRARLTSTASRRRRSRQTATLEEEGVFGGSVDWFAALRGDSVAEFAEAASTNGHTPTSESMIALAARAVAAQSKLIERSDRPAILTASDVVVRFGGLTAVNEVSLEVHTGEIAGLIGPNGAGKTTLFNAILGLNDPSSGEIRLFGTDVSGLPPHMRAQSGVARTFQVLQLFSEMNVFDNVLVATHVHNTSGVLSNLIAGPKTMGAETEARKRVWQVLKMLELDHIAEHGVRGLPFGTLRMVELARALVTGAQLIMLDEPASGLNEAETDRLSDVVRSLRALGVSLLLIEHDVRMVTGVCDYIYVLDQGRLIAEGLSNVIQRHPAVISAYLGEPTEPARI